MPDNPERLRRETLGRIFKRVGRWASTNSGPGKAVLLISFEQPTGGELLACWHDLGKYSDPVFSGILPTANPDELGVIGRVDTATWAAKQCLQLFQDGAASNVRKSIVSRRTSDHAPGPLHRVQSTNSSLGKRSRRPTCFSKVVVTGKTKGV